MQITSLEAHHAIRVKELAGLPIRAVVGQWVRELGVHNGIAVFPGPRNNPGNITRAHVGRVCGYLTGGSSTERHRFPVFCSISEGVKEYIWYFNNLIYYKKIADSAGGNWLKACNLIETSPWSSDHYGRTLDTTARQADIRVGQVSADNYANVRRGPSRTYAAVAHVGRGHYLAIAGLIKGQNIGGNNNWYKVRYGSGNGRFGYIHASVFHSQVV